MVSATSLTGAAGEHFVMSQLLRRGLIAALAPAGVPNCDIVVTDDVGDRAFAVQVKTRRNLGTDGGWHMSKKHEQLASPNLFYCFVDIGREASDHPTVFIVPAPIVADVLARAHQAWLAKPGKGGKAHNDTDFRRFLPDYSQLGMEDLGSGWLEQYRGNAAWDRLKG